MSRNINVEKCVRYLRGIGVTVDRLDADAWLRQEAETRARRRAHRAELKRSCGHFRVSECLVIHEGGEQVNDVCVECHRVVRSRPANSPWPKPRKTLPRPA